MATDQAKISPAQLLAKHLTLGEEMAVLDCLFALGYAHLSQVFC